jgi:anaphase-promoting complex subunit 4
MSGLVVSSIDKWFIGPAPRFSSRDISMLGGDTRDLSAVLDRAEALANDPVQLGQQSVGVASTEPT